MLKTKVGMLILLLLNSISAFASKEGSAFGEALVYMIQGAFVLFIMLIIIWFLTRPLGK